MLRKPAFLDSDPAAASADQSSAVVGSSGGVQLGLRPIQSPDDVDVPLQAYVLDLERRFRLLLADYNQKFGPVLLLGDENAIAQSIGV